MSAQAMEALKKGNYVRTERAKLKREIKAGTRLVADVIADPPDFVETMPVIELLTAQKFCGETRARRMLKRAWLSEAKTVEGLTDSQTLTLCDLLRFG